MKKTLKPGLQYEFKYQVPESKTVPALYPEASEFQVMPKVLATGYLVGLIEWTCIHERFVIDAQKFTEKIAEKTTQEVSS